MKQRIQVDDGALSVLCRQWKIRWLALFGSVLREDFGGESDVDILVDFVPGETPSFFTVGALEEDLSKVFGGRRVDLVTRKYLNRHLRDRVLAEAEVLYAEG